MKLLAAAASLFLSTFALAAPGDLDPAFGSGGKVVVPFSFLGTKGTSVMAVAGGKTVAVGTYSGTTGARLLLVRFDADGAVDPTFGLDGKVTTDDPEALEAVQQPDGKILVLTRESVIDSNNRLVRFNADGSRDLSFGSSGSVAFRTALRVRVQSDGRIVTLGSSFAGPPDNTFYFHVKRYLADGSPDASLGTGGAQSLAVATSPFSSAKALAIQPDGKLVLAGYAFNGSNRDVVVVRTLADGSHDPAFGSGGELVTDLGLSNDEPNDAVVQPDGSIVLVGESSTSGGLRRCMALRYLGDGTLDPAFGSAGIVLTPPLVSTECSLAAVALQADGKIVAAGLEDNAGGMPMFMALRYLADGQLDASFGDAGRRIVTFGGTNPPNTTASDVALQADGKIVLAGVSGPMLVVVRLDTEGDLDPGFADAGQFARGLLPSPFDTMRSVKVRPDGRIVAAGVAAGSVALLQVLPDGSLDNSFGDAGKVFSSTGDPATSIALQTDGKAVVGSQIPTASPSQCRVTRFNTNGTLDTSFAGGGSAVFTSSELEEPTIPVAIQADGKVIAACTNPNPDPHSRIVRLNSNGTVDTSFGVNGFAAVNAGPSFDRINAIAIQPDGGIVVAGKSRDAGGVYRMLVARYDSSGSMSGGPWLIGFSAANAYASSVVIAPDGKIVVAGTADLGNGVPEIALARLLPDGTLDSTFGTGGKVGISWGDSSFGQEVTAAAGGRLYVGATVRMGDLYSIGVLRLTAGGSLDATFGDAGRALVPMTPSTAGGAIALQPDGNVVVAGGPVAFPAGPPAQGVVIARFLGGGSAVGRHDFNSDARPDVLIRNSQNGVTWVFYMDGLAIQSDRLVANIDPQWRLVGHGDFDGDGKNDIVWRSTVNGTAFVMYLNDGVYVSDALLFSVDPLWLIEAVDDFDNDGHPDFLFRHQANGLAFIWYFNNTTPVRDQFLFSIDNSWIVENTGDFNNDGYPDFFFRNMGSGLGFVWYWDGSALGGSNFLFSIDPVWQVVQIVDWNGDGFVDLLFRNAASGTTFVWYTNGTSLQGSDFLFQFAPEWEIVPYR